MKEELTEGGDSDGVRDRAARREGPRGWEHWGAVHRGTLSRDAVERLDRRGSQECRKGLAGVCEGKAGVAWSPSCSLLIWETLPRGNVPEFPGGLCPWAFSMFAVSEPWKGGPLTDSPK